jgi:hypothetical protein
VFECSLAFFDGAGAEEDVVFRGCFGEELADEFEADAAVGLGVLVSWCVFEWSFAVLIGRGLPPVINAMSFLSVMVGSDQLLSCEGMMRWVYMPSRSVVSIPQYRLSLFIVARVDALRCGGVKSALAEIQPQRILCIT